jgi:hypothetical protein
VFANYSILKTKFIETLITNELADSLDFLNESIL